MNLIYYSLPTYSLQFVENKMLRFIQKSPKSVIFLFTSQESLLIVKEVCVEPPKEISAHFQEPPKVV